MTLLVSKKRERASESNRRTSGDSSGPTQSATRGARPHRGGEECNTIAPSRPASGYTAARSLARGRRPLRMLTSCRISAESWSICTPAPYRPVAVEHYLCPVRHPRPESESMRQPSMHRGVPSSLLRRRATPATDPTMLTIARRRDVAGCRRPRRSSPAGYEAVDSSRMPGSGWSHTETFGSGPADLDGRHGDDRPSLAATAMPGAIVPLRVSMWSKSRPQYWSTMLMPARPRRGCETSSESQVGT